MKGMTDVGRFREGRGDLSKHGKAYKPWIEDRDVDSLGTCYRFESWLDDPDDATVLVFLSKAEMKVGVSLMWSPAVVELRTQVPLDPDVTDAVADDLGVARVNGGRTVMTTDMVATLSDGSLLAVGVKPNAGTYGSAEADAAEEAADALDPTLTQEERKERSRARARRKREREKLTIEEGFWDRMGVPFTCAWGDDVDWLFVSNVRDAAKYWAYDPELFRADHRAAARHMVAHRMVRVDLHSDIDYGRLTAELERLGRIRGLIEEGEAA